MVIGPRFRYLYGVLPALAPLYKPMGKPLAGEWLAAHEEPGQSFGAWCAMPPVLARPPRRVLYIMPLGFAAAAPAVRAILDATTEFLAAFFQLPVVVLPEVSLDLIPAEARRLHPVSHHPQLLSSHILQAVMAPRLPPDAAAMLCLTSQDLFPRPGWNFVFGQALLRKRVGVWSIYRNGDPAADFRRVLWRTLKTAAHETCHMFSIRHCTAYECLMSGANSQDERERRPLEPCPADTAKLLRATCVLDPRPRYAQLLAFAERHGFEREATLYRASLAALEPVMVEAAVAAAAEGAAAPRGSGGGGGGGRGGRGGGGRGGGGGGVRGGRGGRGGGRGGRIVEVGVPVFGGGLLGAFGL